MSAATAPAGSPAIETTVRARSLAASDGHALAATFLRQLREAARQGRNGDRRNRTRSTTKMLEARKADANDKEPLLWNDLPAGWRDDDLAGTLATLLANGGPGVVGHNDGALPSDVFDWNDPLQELRERWRASVASPIPVVTVPGVECDDPQSDMLTSGDGNGVLQDTLASPRKSDRSSATQVPNMPTPGRLAARWHRCSDPSLLPPALALTGAMLGAALAARNEVGADLVHGAPVVVVRAPQGLDHHDLSDCIETCLTDWPFRSASACPVNKADQHAGGSEWDPYGRDDFDDDLGRDRSDDEGVVAVARPAGGAFPKRKLSIIDACIERREKGGVGRSAFGGKASTSKGALTDSYAQTIVSIQSSRGTVIVLASHDTQLSAEVSALADHEMTLHLPDARVLKQVIEAVTGERASSLPGSLWDDDPNHAVPLPDGTSVDGPKEGPNDAVPPPGSTAASPSARFSVHDLRASLSPVRGARGSIERLVRLVNARAVRSDTGVSAGSEDAPPLERLTGYGKAKADGLAIAADLQAYRAGELGWASVTRGMVLAGPPGTGKTLFARALANSAGMRLVVGSMADWQSHREGHLGDMIAAMRACFAEARAHAPCILFIDELDSIGNRATFHSRHRDYSTQVVNALLQELDGAVGREGVVVIGATNNPNAIDPAVLRPGRMERVVWIGLPDLNDLIGMLRMHLSGVAVVSDKGPTNVLPTGSDLPDVTLRPVALALRGRTGADVAAVVRRARGAARRANRPLAVADLLSVVREDTGPDRPERVIRRTCAHEAGHAVVALALNVGEVRSLAIDRDGGVAQLRFRPTEQTIEAIEDMLVFLLAGRAAEIVLLGTASAGAGGTEASDLARATRMAASLHSSFGLGRTLVWHGPSEDGRDFAYMPPELREDVEATLAKAQERSLSIVRTERAAVERIAERLQRDGYVEGELVRQLREGDDPLMIGS